MINSGNFKPLKFWCQMVLPTVYDDSLSFYELLNKVVFKLNELGEYYNELSEQLSNLGETVSAEVEKQLQEMIDNGELEELINNTLLNSKVDKDAPKSNSLAVQTIINRWGFRTSGLGTIQSCAASENGNVIASYSADGESATTATLCEYSMSSRQLIRTANIDGGHAAGITYNPDNGNLYVAKLYTRPDVYTLDLAVVNYSTFTQTGNQTITGVSGNGLLGVAYNHKTKQYVILDNNYNIYLFSNNFELILQIQYSIPEKDKGADYFVVQSLCTDDKYIYIQYYQPGEIYVIDYDGNFIATYSWPTFANNTPLQELEGMCYDRNAKTWYATNNTFANRVREYVETSILQVDFRRNVVSEPLLRTGSGTPAYPQTLYVKGSYTGYYSDGSSDYPFVSPQQAINRVGCPAYSCLIINISAGTYDGVYYEGAYKDILMYGTGNNTIINGMNFLGCTQITLQGLAINGSINGTTNNASVTLTRSNAQFHSITFTNPPSGGYDINANTNSKVSLSGTITPNYPAIYLSRSFLQERVAYAATNTVVSDQSSGISTPKLIDTSNKMVGNNTFEYGTPPRFILVQAKIGGNQTTELKRIATATFTLSWNGIVSNVPYTFLATITSSLNTGAFNITALKQVSLVDGTVSNVTSESVFTITNIMAVY